MATSNFISREPLTVRCKRLVPRHTNAEKVSDRQERVPGWNQEKLQSSIVVMQGGGGIGSVVSRSLVRQGVYALFICDPDIVQPSNLNRQEFEFGDLLKPKAHQLALSLGAMGVQGTSITGYPLYFQEFLQVYRGPTPDMVISGVDNNAARLEAARWCRQIRKPLICAGVAPDAGGAYVFVQIPGEACLGCYLGEHLLTGGLACPGTPAVLDILLVLAGHVSFAVTSLLMQRERSWNVARFFLATGSGDSRVAAIDSRCPLCNGKGA